VALSAATAEAVARSRTTTGVITGTANVHLALASIKNLLQVTKWNKSDIGWISNLPAKISAIPIKAGDFAAASTGCKFMGANRAALPRLYGVI
jgi:hypothetical protein